MTGYMLRLQAFKYSEHFEQLRQHVVVLYKIECMKFRFHFGGYDESMKTTRTVENIEQIRTLVKNKVKHEPFHKLVGIEFVYSGFDKRNGWDTWLVVAVFDTSEKIVVGMSDGKF